MAAMDALSSSFWRGKRVLLTGHTGFKGSWLALWLQQLGAELTGFALEQPKPEALFHRARVADGMRSLIVDLRDLDGVRRVVRESRPEIVLHLAAQPLVGAAFHDPLETYAVNVMGTAHLLDALRQTGTARVIEVITTDKCYDNREWEYPYRETDTLGGKDPYSSSKACAELVTDCYRRSYLGAQGVSVSTARAGNVIGGGDWSDDRIVPDCMRAFAKGEALVLRRPKATRPWQHVLEPLAGYLELAWRQWQEPRAFAQAWNFGPNTDGQLSVEDVVQRLIRHWGGGEYRVDPDSARFPEAGLLALDISKALAHLAWRPRLTADAALAKTAAWYRAAATPTTDMRAFTLAQIDDYLKDARA